MQTKASMQLPVDERVHVPQARTEDLQMLREKAKMAIAQSQDIVNLSKSIRRHRRIHRVLQTDSFAQLMQEIKRESMSRSRQETLQSLLSHPS